MQLEVTSLSIDLKASGTGPTKAAVGSNVDGYASVAGFPVTTAGGAVSVPLSGIDGIAGSVELPHLRLRRLLGGRHAADPGRTDGHGSASSSLNGVYASLQRGEQL